MSTNPSINSLIACTTLAVLGAAAGSQVHAQQDQTTYPATTDRRATTDEPMMNFRPYVGANYGFYQSDEGDYDSDRNMWELYAGISWNRYIGVEVNWTNLAALDTDLIDVDIDGWGLAAVGQVPFEYGFSVYGKLGVLFWDADVDTDDFSQAFDGDELFFTVGAGYDLAQGMDMEWPLTVTLEYTRYNTEIEIGDVEVDSDVSDLDTVKLGLRLAF